MSVNQLIRRTGRFEEVRPYWGSTVGFFLGRKRHGGSIFVQANWDGPIRGLGAIAGGYAAALVKTAVGLV
ncbi:MAG: hypothetical protein OXI33_11280 [Chloroflexota bacterium]|nr:hypothetical protein [Chloroflexota bacterium]